MRKAYIKRELVAKPGSKIYVHLLCGVMSGTKETFASHFFSDPEKNLHNVVFWDYAETCYHDYDMADEIAKYAVSCGEGTKHIFVGVSFGARVMHIVAKRFVLPYYEGKYEAEFVAITPMEDYRMSKHPMLRKHPVWSMILANHAKACVQVCPLRKKRFVKSSTSHPYWGSHEDCPQHMVEYFAEDTAGTKTQLGLWMDQLYAMTNKSPVSVKMPKCALVLVDDEFVIGGVKGDWHVDYAAAKALYEELFDKVNLIEVRAAHARMNSWYREYREKVFLPLGLVE